MHLITLAQLNSWIAARKGSKGIVSFRRVAELAEPAAESPMETRLRLLLIFAGLPRPEAQARLYGKRGEFLGRVDLFYRSPRLAIEYDGGTHRDSLIEDNRRQNGLLVRDSGSCASPALTSCALRTPLSPTCGRPFRKARPFRSELDQPTAAPA